MTGLEAHETPGLRLLLPMVSFPLPRFVRQVVRHGPGISRDNHVAMDYAIQFWLPYECCSYRKKLRSVYRVTAIHLIELCVWENSLSVWRESHSPKPWTLDPT